MVSMIIFFSPIYYLWRFVFFGWEYNNEKPGLIHFNYVVGFAKMKVGRMFNFARWPRLKVGAVKGNRNWKSWKYKSTDKGADLCKGRQSCGENSVTWERWWESFFSGEKVGETERRWGRRQERGTKRKSCLKSHRLSTTMVTVVMTIVLWTDADDIKKMTFLLL